MRHRAARRAEPGNRTRTEACLQRFLRPPRLPFRQPGVSECRDGRESILAEQMFARYRRPSEAYLRSRAVLSVGFQPSSVCRGLAARIVTASDAAAERRRLARLLA